MALFPKSPSQARGIGLFSEGQSLVFFLFFLFSFVCVCREYISMMSSSSRGSSARFSGDGEGSISKSAGASGPVKPQAGKQQQAEQERDVRFLPPCVYSLW